VLIVIQLAMDALMEKFLIVLFVMMKITEPLTKLTELVHVIVTTMIAKINVMNATFGA